MTFNYGSQKQNSLRSPGIAGFGSDQEEKKYHFSGHETFPFRYTWLPKCVRHIQEDPHLFYEDDAIVILGVGKNVVRSIRHWCDTLGLIESVEGKRGHYQATEFGKRLFDPNGWDPYLENPGTLWLLHWKLVSQWEKASTWYLAFTRWRTEEFTRDKLAAWIWQLKETESPTSRGTKASLKRDADVFLRTYIPARATHTRPLEDTFDCPLVELGIISEISRNTYQFVRGPKPSLPDGIFLYALLEFWKDRKDDQNTLSFEEIMHADGAPGGAFKLTENALVERLERLSSFSNLSYGDTAGSRAVLRTSSNEIDLLKVLQKFYISEITTVGRS